MVEKLSPGQSGAISFIRAAAVILIVTCHFFQGYGSQYAFILNVGVQTFLYMSGFLAAGTRMDSIKNWYGKKAKRILIPYLCFLVPVLILYHFAAPGKTSAAADLIYLTGLQGFAPGNYTIDGLGHLWFITVILLSYAITPILYRKKTGHALLFCAVFCLLLFLIHKSYAFWVGVYVLGFYMRKFGKNPVVIPIAVTVAAAAGYYFLSGRWEILFNIVAHAGGGIAIFTLLFNINNCKSVNNGGGVIDRYSYEIYIVHHIFILGPFSLLFLTPFKTMNILVIILLICLATVVLKKASTLISSKL